MKLLKSERGAVGPLELLLVLLLVLALSFVGWRIYTGSTEPAKTYSPSAKKNDGSKPAEKSTQTDYVAIPELGVKYKNTGEITDVAWQKYENDPNNEFQYVGINLYSKAFIKKLEELGHAKEAQNCKQGSMGGLFKAEKNKLKPDDGSSEWSETTEGMENAAKNGGARDFGTYYLYAAGPQSYCFNFEDKELEKLQNPEGLRKKFIEALEKI